MGIFISGSGGAPPEDWRENGEYTQFYLKQDMNNFQLMLHSGQYAYSYFNFITRVDDYCTNVDNMFHDCQALNSEVVFGKKVESYRYTFNNCRNFNSNITIMHANNNVLSGCNFIHMFDNAKRCSMNFMSNYKIENSNCWAMFQGADNIKIDSMYFGDNCNLYQAFATSDLPNSLTQYKSINNLYIGTNCNCVTMFHGAATGGKSYNLRINNISIGSNCDLQHFFIADASSAGEVSTPYLYDLRIGNMVIGNYCNCNKMFNLRYSNGTGTTNTYYHRAWVTLAGDISIGTSCDCNGMFGSYYYYVIPTNANLKFQFTGNLNIASSSNYANLFQTMNTGGYVVVDRPANIFIRNYGGFGPGNYQNFLIRTNQSKRVNIYFNDCDTFKTYNLYGGTLTWESLSDGNGYYNAAANTYLYNNTWTASYIIPESQTDCSNMFRGEIGFNQPVTMHDGITNASYMFYTCRNLRCEINIPNNLINASHMFHGCLNYPYNVSIPESVVNASYMFAGINAITYPITIPENTRDVSYLLSGCRNYNVPTTIPAGKNADFMIYGCSNFNSELTIEDGVTSIAGLVASCPNYNLPVTIPNSVTNMQRAFASAVNFNQPVNIPDGVTDISYIFQSASVFNQPIAIPDSVVNASWAFAQSNLNQPITLNGVNDISYAFYYAPAMNSPINITLNGNSNINHAFYEMTSFSNTVTINGGRLNNTSGGISGGTFSGLRNGSYLVLNTHIDNGANAFQQIKNINISLGGNIDIATNMFYSCSQFNGNVNICGNINNASNMFYACSNYNTPLTISGNINTAINIMYSCSDYKCPVYITGRVNNAYMMFYAQSTMLNRQNIYINSIGNAYQMFNASDYAYTTGNIIISAENNDNSLMPNNFCGMLRSRPTGKQRIYIYCKNLSLVNGTYPSNSITAASIAWSTTTNGYYNASYNIYLFNNI